MAVHPRRPGGRPVWILVGPTGVGKSEVALAVARRIGAEIISADSRQVYRGLSAGTAKPVGDWRETAAGPRYVAGGVVHHGVDVADPTEPFTAGRFVQVATAALRDLSRRDVPALIVGGTGLYVRSLVRGLAPLPPRSDALRAEWDALVLRKGRAHLHGLLAEVDPAAARAIPVNNTQRVQRALEVHRLTGRPLSDWQAKETRPADWDFEWNGLDMAPEIHRGLLRDRCAAMAGGILEECAALRKRGVPPDAPAFQSLGYREAVACLEGKMDRPAFEAAFFRQTLLYVKRQRTWFRAEPVRWWSASLPFEAASIADEMLHPKK